MLLIKLARNAGLTFSAQAVSSLTNFVVSALALGAGSLEEFGRFSIALQVCVIVIAAGQGGTGTAVLIHGSGDDDQAGGTVALVRQGIATAALLFGVMVGILLLAAGLIIGGDLGRLLLYSALGAPALICQYTYRSALFAQQRPGRVVAIDTAWLAVVVAAAALNFFTPLTLTSGHFLVAWLLGATVSAAPYIAHGLTGNREALAHFWRSTGVQSVRTAADGLLARSILVVALIAVSALINDRAAGALAAATLLFSPLSVVNASAPSVVVPPEIRARGIHVVRRSLPLMVALVTTGITVAWAAVILVVQELDVTLGPFDMTANDIGMGLYLATLLRFVALALWQGPIVGLRIADAATESLEARFVATIVQWALPLLALAVESTVTMAAFGLGAATLVGAGYVWLKYLRLPADGTIGARPETAAAGRSR